MSEDSDLPQDERVLRRPDQWLPAVAPALDAALRDAVVEGVAGGNGWLSLRVGGRFLWCVASLGLRLAWLSDRAVPTAWLDWLGRHRSPFAPHLVGRRVRGITALAGPDGREEGLVVDLSDPPGHLFTRFWPRPGALWLEDAEGEIHAQSGRMGGETLRRVREASPSDHDLDHHADACETMLRRRLAGELERRLRRRQRNETQRLRRREKNLHDDLADAEAHRGLREQADLLAAHQHELEAGQSTVRLLDFEGREVEVRLDPRLRPHQNVDRLYRRIARAERKATSVRAQLTDLAQQQRRQTELADELEGLSREDASLDAWIELAQARGLRPSTPKEKSSRGRTEPRRPYWSYLIDGTWEVRVGRSARDNDELLRHHGDGRDLWLHAQGCAGSHVLVRTARREVPRRVLLSAACLAAHFSRDRNSETVPVLHCEKRHVRKPRKAAPGEVVADRAETIFVQPGIPENCRRTD